MIVIKKKERRIATGATAATRGSRDLPKTGQEARDRLSARQEARIVFMRFGLGPKPGAPRDFWTVKGAAYDALVKELEKPSAVIIPPKPLDGGRTDIVTNALPNGVETPSVNLDGIPTPQQCGHSEKGERHLAWMQADLRARHRKAQEPTIGYLERLVLFWSNHFSIHWNKDNITRGATGRVEREAVRPNVVATYPDMLKAVIRQPAMLAYLDNRVNVGPNSNWGIPEQKHINENLAREVLELYTVGVAAGYSQSDVIELAYALTGYKTRWQDGTFEYAPVAQEEGSRTILNTVYPQIYNAPAGPKGKPPRESMTAGQVENILESLAVNEFTRKHLAYKIIRHFITDAPAPASVQQLADAFGPTGDLKKMALALLELPEAWDPRTFFRIRTPQLTLSAMNRALGFTDDQINALSSQTPAMQGAFEAYLNPLGHEVWGRITPDGYPDENLYWLTDSALRLRKDLGYLYLKSSVTVLNAEGFPFALPDPLELANSLFPEGALSKASVDLITSPTSKDPVIAKSTPDRAASLALLFMTNEFLCR